MMSNANIPYSNNAPMPVNVAPVAPVQQVPVYGGYYHTPCFDYGYGGYGCGGYGHGFALIVVLFILLIIIGACTFHHGDKC
ncbi:YjcZ family sporulation protein [Ectobacillus funiculus]|uniref:YjcZ family sporulation protein n=1 Tax=Ectobacillus funiculus TaxID=137993 RepID=A0ABV5WDA5_9BACI